MGSSATKQFQYEIQDYQEKCVNNICSLFDLLRQKVNFLDVLKSHHAKNNYKYPVLDTKNIDIMMETGTGKTFTFIKTIFELNKKFSYKKFIILIPTVPIREGTKTNLEDTKEYFKSFYANEKEKEIETFVYEGGNISAIKQFINNSHLSVLVMTPSSFNSKDNILNRPLEQEIHAPELFENNQEPPKSLLDCLKRINPIVIMDEPHRFEGDAFKTYFEGFENYFLRFGATFPNKKESLILSNVAYVLDSISSFRQNLVKKIVVYTQGVVDNTDTLIGIENKKAIVNTISNGLVIKRILEAGSIFNGKSIKKINKENLVLTDESIVKLDYTLSDESIRLMIKETIKIHFEKEKGLFEKGIKALSLFFIESDTSLFRGDNPKVKIIFEEEYKEQHKKVIEKIDQECDYYKYLQCDFGQDGKLQVHKGYFSGDKGNSDEKIKSGVDEILKDKKKLLSFESPTRFIFSIWALQEGWDNPNVFTICKLSNQGSENTKLQQIGRGLRISVNQDLQRNTMSKLNDNQEEFWEINNLDVVVSSKEQGYVEAIQKEILENSKLLSEVLFTEQELFNALKEKSELEDDIIEEIIEDVLFEKKLIVKKTKVQGQTYYEKSPEFISILCEANLPASQSSLIESIFDINAKTFVQNGNSISKKKRLYIKTKHLDDFKQMWYTINQNADFILDILTHEEESQLIQNIKTEIETIPIYKNTLNVVRSELNINQTTDEVLISEKTIDSIAYKGNVDYIKMVKEIAKNDSVNKKPSYPISFIVKIFNSLNDDFKNNMIINNPLQAQSEIKKIINKNVISTIKANVRYDGINGQALPNVFLSESGKTYLATGSVGKFQKVIENDFSLKTKWVFEELFEYDSDFELKIIQGDNDNTNIDIFGKLPRLNIKTPLGNYNPDFCYAIKNANGNKVFLVVEAKGYNTSTEIPEDEKVKIAFGRKYFESLSEYYKDKNIKISFEERITTTTLETLIKNVQ